MSIHINKKNYIDDGYYYAEIGCKSTDTKPVDEMMATESLCHEVDTKQVYAYDADSQTWIIQCELG